MFQVNVLSFILQCQFCVLNPCITIGISIIRTSLNYRIRPTHSSDISSGCSPTNLAVYDALYSMRVLPSLACFVVIKTTPPAAREP